MGCTANCVNVMFWRGEEIASQTDARYRRGAPCITYNVRGTIVNHSKNDRPTVHTQSYTVYYIFPIFLSEMLVLFTVILRNSYHANNNLVTVCEASGLKSSGPGPEHGIWSANR